MASERDRALVDYVQRLIRTGALRIRVPSLLFEGTSQEAQEAVRDVCRVNNVEIEIVVG
jgi:hypothetical protein